MNDGTYQPESNDEISESDWEDVKQHYVCIFAAQLLPTLIKISVENSSKLYSASDPYARCISQAASLSNRLWDELQKYN